MEENKNAGSSNPPPEIQTTGDLNVVVNQKIEAAQVDPKPETQAPHGSVEIIQSLAKAVEPEITKAEIENQTFLMATNPYMMGKAQARLVQWAKDKLAELKAELKDHKDNLAIASKLKIRTEAYKRYIATTGKKIEMQEKILSALEAGYCIVPDMDVELFAIRTTKKKPKSNDRYAHNNAEYGVHAPDVPDQVTNSPPAGKGEYVDPVAAARVATKNYKDSKTGKDMIENHSWASSFNPTIDFPFKLARPAILDATTKAMALKIFDEIGVLPKSRIQPDPVIVGRIIRRVNSYTFVRFNFLIAWFLDVKDL